MDAASRDMLDEILRKPIGHMTAEERGFVRARRDYLTEAQCEDLAEVLEEVPEVTGEGEGEDTPDYSKLKKAELEKLCEERGIDFSEAKTNADKVALLEAADAEEEEDEE